jgi:hypothetical protein
VQQEVLRPSPALIAAFLFFALLSDVAVWKTVSEVNARLPDDQRFPYLRWTLGKYKRLWMEHKRLCPHSHWRLYSVLSLGLAALFMITVVWSAWLNL